MPPSFQTHQANRSIQMHIMPRLNCQLRQKLQQHRLYRSSHQIENLLLLSAIIEKESHFFLDLNTNILECTYKPTQIVILAVHAFCISYLIMLCAAHNFCSAGVEFFSVKVTENDKSSLSVESVHFCQRYVKTRHRRLKICMS